MKIARKALAPLAILLIIIAFFWKLLLTNQYSWMESPDLAYQVLPWFDFQARQFHQHVIPLWDPLMFGGQSLIGQDQPGLAYPLNWILFLMPLKQGHINVHYLNWYYMLIHYFAALFCYWLCRDLEIGEIASVMGGLAFGLGGYVGNVNWPQMINGAIWAPLVFLFILRAVRSGKPNRNAVFAGVFLGMSWLSGHHQVPIFLTLAAFAIWIYYLFCDGRMRKELLAPAAVFFGFFVLGGAMQMWPSFAYGHTAVRWVGSQHDPVTWKQPVPYTVHRRYSMDPKFLLGILIPGYDNGNTPFTGIVALALAALALARRWFTREVRVFSYVGIAGLFLALGDSNIFHGILYAIVPVFEKARTPSTALFLFHFAIAVLLAYGMDQFLSAENSALLRRSSKYLTGFGAGLYFLIIIVFIGKGQQWIGSDRFMVTVLATMAMGGLAFRMSSANSSRVAIAVLTGALFLIEMGNSTLLALANSDEPDRTIYLSHYGAAGSVATFLKQQPGPLRVWLNMDDVPINFGDWFGIDTLTGYAASLPATFYNLETYTQRGRALYGAAYSVSRKPLFDDQKEVFRDSSGLGVYRNPDVLPRAWTVHSSVVVKSPLAAQRMLQNPATDIAKQTFVDQPLPRLESCAGDSIRSFGRSTNGSRIEVDMACRGLLVESENSAPGWIAWVDGVRTPIYDAYTALRGVVVSRGRHTVVMKYRPMPVIAGAIATLLAWLSALILRFRR